MASAASVARKSAVVETAAFELTAYPPGGVGPFGVPPFVNEKSARGSPLIRGFLMHVPRKGLPHRNRHRARKVALCRELLGTTHPHRSLRPRTKR
jgi:hypothetical protein